MHKIIQLISGPRNISTALMYSFGNRMDTTIVDEPFYSYYLNRNPKIEHPGREQILQSQSHEFETILKEIIFNPIDTPLLFFKNMAHHLKDSDWSFLKKTQNVFLIRNPKQLIASFAQVMPEPKMQDIGLKQECELFIYSQSLGQTPIVLDSNEVLKNPKNVLMQLCQALRIPFDEAMLKWEAGARKEDGVWAKYWYANVHKSTGFMKQETSNRSFPNNLLPLLSEAQKYYDLLYTHSIKAE